MIRNIPGWSWEIRHDAIVTAPPEGKAAGYIRYVERQRPVLRVRELVKQLERDPRFRITRIGKPARMITDEGEYGAVVTVDGLLLEAPIQHVVAFVFIDDWYSMIDGVSLRADTHARFADLVRNYALYDAHSAGELRRRRFWFDPHAFLDKGWAGLSRGLYAFYYPPDFPVNNSKISIFPAIPVPPGSSRFIDGIAQEQTEQVSDFSLDSKREPTPHVTAHKLGGSFWDAVGKVAGGVVFRDIHVLEDGRFAYTVVLDSPPSRHEENRALLRALVDSIEPVPREGEMVSQESKESMGHWAE